MAFKLKSMAFPIRLAPNDPNAQCSKCYEISDMEFLIKIYNQIDILGISIDHFQWFTIILAIKSKRVENISPKFNKGTVKSANPLNKFLDLVLLIT